MSIDRRLLAGERREEEPDPHFEAEEAAASERKLQHQSIKIIQIILILQIIRII